MFSKELVVNVLYLSINKTSDKYNVNIFTDVKQLLHRLEVIEV